MQSGGKLQNGNPSGDPSKAPRCGARTRQGTACQAPAMPNGRCRMHGGKSTGPKTIEGRYLCSMARFVHGNCVKDELNNRKVLRELMKRYRDRAKGF